MSDLPLDCYLISCDFKVLDDLIQIVSEGLTSEEYDDDYHRRLGLAFDFPGCCVEKFVNQARTWPKWAGYASQHHGPDEHDGTMHLWCTPECVLSKRLQAKYLRVLTRSSVQSWTLELVNVAGRGGKRDFNDDGELNA